MSEPPRELKMPIGFEVHMDGDVKLVLEFMKMNIPQEKLIPVARAVNQLAEPMFYNYQEDDPVLGVKFIPLGFRPGHHCTGH